MIKVIFFDVDGTLISETRPYLSEGVIDALNQLRAQEIKLFIASGRHYLELEDLGINQQYTFDGYLTLNGGLCFNQEGIIYKNPINQEDIKNVVTYAMEHNLACNFVEDNDLYVNTVDDYVIAAQNAINTPIPPIKDISRALENDVYQINPYVDRVTMEKLIGLTKHCKYTQWHEGAYDVIAKNGGKQEGIMAVIKHYNIDIKETMAFGDGHNDVDMLKLVGIGVCMENGHEETKQASDYVCPSVDDDGIVSALKYYSLL